jgi:hypothetical protein
MVVFKGYFALAKMKAPDLKYEAVSSLISGDVGDEDLYSIQKNPPKGLPCVLYLRSIIRKQTSAC